MICDACGFENRPDARFCLRCGEGLAVHCAACGREVPADAEFCDGCGTRLVGGAAAGTRDASSDAVAPDETAASVDREAEGERKHVTVMFSDLSGYTAMAERLDPEEVREITTRVFGEIAGIVAGYEGVVEKYVGDAVMAVFGVPRTHEDDAVRAVRAALEIQRRVAELAGQLTPDDETRLAVHTGVNSGLVVVGEVDVGRGIHGVAGDTVNVAARLSSAAAAGGVLAGADTVRHAERAFTFEPVPPLSLKGKARPVQAYRLVGPREAPSSVHRLSGLRAELTGRSKELAALRDAVAAVGAGRGGVVSITGEAGTGKSRLVEELKAGLDRDAIDWQEGHAYAYTENVPYAPVVDLLRRAWRIEDRDSPDRVRAKVTAGAGALLGGRAELIPYLGSLFELPYPELEDITPEHWKNRLHEAVLALLAGLARRGPTVICLEDLHWADPESLDLLRFLLARFPDNALLICVSRPPFALPDGARQGQRLELRLGDLSPAQALSMAQSLLESEDLPGELKEFILSRLEGNPFYVEEALNTLIESGTLVRRDGGWTLARPLTEFDLPSTVQELIAARLDRLEREAKRVLQEASVIGRAFLERILKGITTVPRGVDASLSRLQKLSIIRARRARPHLEYLFKHALTQEVAYSGLLHRERAEIHERIAHVMEELFQDRLSEFYETLAFHYRRGRSVDRAVHYLVAAGEKSWRRYALDASDRYFREAYALLTAVDERSAEQDALLIEVLTRWSIVLNHRGAYKEMIELLGGHEPLATALDDAEVKGLFFGWLGYALQCRERLEPAYRYLRRALELAEDAGSAVATAYVSAWLTRTCGDMGRLDEAVEHGQRALRLIDELPPDQALFRFTHAHLGLAHYFRGDRAATEDISTACAAYARRYSDVRSELLAHVNAGNARLIAGDYPGAIEAFQRAIGVSVDPMYKAYARLMLGLSYASADRFEEAERTLTEVLAFDRDHGFCARRKAEAHLSTAMEVAKRIGARTVLGECYLDLAALRRHTGDVEGARDAVTAAIAEFEACGGDVFLERARAELAVLSARAAA